MVGAYVKESYVTLPETEGMEGRLSDRIDDDGIMVPWSEIGWAGSRCTLLVRSTVLARL